MVKLVQYTLVVAILCTYPLQLFPVIQVAERFEGGAPLATKAPPLIPPLSQGTPLETPRKPTSRVWTACALSRRAWREV